MSIDWTDVQMELSAAGREDLSLFVCAKLKVLHDARLERMTAAALTGMLSNAVTGDGKLWDSAEQWKREMAECAVEFAVATCEELDKDRSGER